MRSSSTALLQKSLYQIILPGSPPVPCQRQGTPLLHYW